MRNSTTADQATGLWTRRGALTAGAALAAGSLTPTSAATATGLARTGAGAISTPRDAIATTSSGPVRGFKRSGVYIFKGIPYGDDTSGAKRFMPPRAPRAWQDPRWSLAYGPVVDGNVLPENWERSAPSISAAVPMIIGNVRDEFRDINLSFSDANLAEAVPPPWHAQAAGIPAAFNNTRRAETFTGDTAEARIVAAQMSAAFVRFARSGNPGAGWAPFEPGLVPTMVFDARSRMENDPAGAARKLLG